MTLRFERDLRKLDRGVQRRIIDFVEARVDGAGDPRVSGKALGHELAGLWRYRVGDYRILCRMEDGQLLVIAVAVEHRNRVYER